MFSEDRKGTGNILAIIIFFGDVFWKRFAIFCMPTRSRTQGNLFLLMTIIFSEYPISFASVQDRAYNLTTDSKSIYFVSMFLGIFDITMSKIFLGSSMYCVCRICFYSMTQDDIRQNILNWSLPMDDLLQEGF